MYNGKSGYFIFVNDHRVWPKGIQIEGNYRNVLIPYPMDTTIKFTEEPGALHKARRPPGAWNSIEIASKTAKVVPQRHPD